MAGASGAASRTGGWQQDLIPGILLSIAIAGAGLAGAWLVQGFFPIPALVVALFAGIAFHDHAAQTIYRPGIDFCVRKVLRFGVALLGLRTAIADISSLGFGTIGLVLAAMLLTIASGFLFARMLGQDRNYGALVGVGTAVCGASAALAVSMVLPDYASKKADTIFVVVVLNTLATIAMVTYPPLCVLLGLDAHATGVMLGATIHDVAQVAGSVFPLSETTASTAIVVKLFRVFILFPLVVAVGWSLSRSAMAAGTPKVPIPVFALGFIALAIVNSIVPMMPDVAPVYAVLKPSLIQLANLALLLAMAALGLSTSVRTMLSLGWRHLATLLASSMVILLFVVGGLETMW